MRPLITETSGQVLIKRGVVLYIPHYYTVLLAIKGEISSYTVALILITIITE